MITWYSLTCWTFSVPAVRACPLLPPGDHVHRELPAQPDPHGDRGGRALARHSGLNKREIVIDLTVVFMPLNNLLFDFSSWRCKDHTGQCELDPSMIAGYLELIEFLRRSRKFKEKTVVCRSEAEIIDQGLLSTSMHQCDHYERRSWNISIVKGGRLIPRTADIWESLNAQKYANETLKREIQQTSVFDLGSSLVTRQREIQQPHLWLVKTHFLRQFVTFFVTWK